MMEEECVTKEEEQCKEEVEMECNTVEKQACTSIVEQVSSFVHNISNFETKQNSPLNFRFVLFSLSLFAENRRPRAVILFKMFCVGM